MKKSSSSSRDKPIVQSISVVPTKTRAEKKTRRRDACTTTPKTDFENDDENDGWTTTYEPAKPRHQNKSAAKGMMETPHPSKRKTTVTTTPPKTNAAKRKLSSSSSSSTAMTTRTKTTTTTTTTTTGRRLRYVLEFDGASRGNPGPAGAGALIRAPRGDEAFLDGLALDDEDSARAALLELCGVGRKVADCILLMSYAYDGCVPVDTHCFQLAQAWLCPSVRGKSLTAANYQAIVDRFHQIFGDEKAGWAFMTLFCAAPKIWWKRSTMAW